MQKNEELTFKKIEVDEKTQIPKIVELSESEYKKTTESNVPAIEGALSVNNTSASLKTDNKQLVMSRVFGTGDDASVTKRQKLLKRICSTIFVLFVVGVLVFTFYRDFFSTGKTLATSDELSSIFSSSWFYVLLAIASLGFCFIFKGAKLSVMCKSITKKWSFKTCMQTGVIGHYYNNITPLAVGGQPFEIYHLTKHGIDGGTASSMAIATYFLNQFAFVFLGIVALVLYSGNFLGLSSQYTQAFPQAFSILAIVGLFFALLMPVLIIVFSMLPKFGAKIVRLVMKIGGKLKFVKEPEATAKKTITNLIHNADCLKRLAKSPLVFTASLLLSFGEQLALCSIAYFTLRFFGFDMVNVRGLIEWTQIVQLCLILYAAISFIPTPGNSGAADLSFYLLFSIGLSGGLTFSAMVTWRLISFYSFIIVGFILTTAIKKAEHKNVLLHVNE